MVEIADSPLVLTKLRLPAVRSRHISRSHLLDRLMPAGETGPGLVLVCAPAGYGKTSLLAEWAHALRLRGEAVAWVALDSGDDSPVMFGSYLVASLVQAIGPSPELTVLTRLLRSSPEIDLSGSLPAIINAVAAASRPCWLVLDDYHLIGSPAVHTAVAFLIEHRPENLHVVLGSRSDPPLPLGRLRARGQLVELRLADLRFTPQETRRFLNQVMQLDLQPEMADALEKRTEGWAAGLQLAALSLSGRPNKEAFLASFLGSHRYLVEYLLEEVLHQQPRDVQDFLLCTSVLERLCGGLCDAVVESREWRVESGHYSPLSTLHSREILDHLDRANLFLIPLDDEQRWFRYHHLFRDFLLARLRKTRPDWEAGLHRSACEWFAAAGAASGVPPGIATAPGTGDLPLPAALREAARHAFQTRDWDYAAAFVEQHSFTMLLHSELAAIAEWCSALPEDVIRNRPMLCIHQCWPWVFRYRRENRARIEARLQQARQAAAAQAALQGDSPALAGEVSEAAAVIRTFLSMAPDPQVDPRQELAHTGRLLEGYPEGHEGQFSALLTRGYCYLALQETQAAVEALEAARQAALNGRLFFGVVESTFCLARLAHARGELRRAAEICREGQATLAALLARPEQEVPGIGSLDIALGCLLLEQDRLEEAEARLLHGFELVGAGASPFYVLTACTALARLREIQGQPAQAEAFLARLEEAWPDVGFYTQGLRLLQRLPDPGAAESRMADAAAWCAEFTALFGGSPEEPSEGAREATAFLPGMGPYGAAEVYYGASLAWARLQIALGRPQPALAYLERQRTLAQTHSLAARVIELSLLEAQAAQAAGEDGSRVRAALERALAAAQPEGFVRTFDQGPGLVRLLVEAARSGLYPEVAGHILAAITRPVAAPPASEQTAARRVPGTILETGEQLSEREQEVLRLMAQGATNQAIAEQLVITVGTVKSHINHILGKLDSHNRTQAVARARLLGLLEI